MQYQLLDCICMCLFLSFPFLLIEPFLFERKTFSSVNSNIHAVSTNRLHMYLYIFVFFPFLLDLFDFLWGEPFLLELEQFPDQLVQWSTADILCSIV
jgi:hypothetical protein